MASVTAPPLARTPISSDGTALTLTNSFQDIPGASISLPVGNWMVVGAVHLVEIGAGDVTFDLYGQLVTSGGAATITPSASLPFFTPETAGQAHLQTNVWSVVVTSATTAKLQGRKSGGTGTSATSVYTHITAFPVGYF